MKWLYVDFTKTFIWSDRFVLVVCAWYTLNIISYHTRFVTNTRLWFFFLFTQDWLRRFTYINSYRLTRTLLPFYKIETLQWINYDMMFEFFTCLLVLKTYFKKQILVMEYNATLNDFFFHFGHFSMYQSMLHLKYPKNKM